MHPPVPRYARICLTVLLAASCGAADVLLDAGWDEGAWQFLPGSEFPGAAGAIARPRETPGPTLSWDFAGGGVYVAARFAGPLPPALTAFALSVAANVPCRVAWRVEDAGGRVFQSPDRDCPAGEGVLACALAGPWARAWGGGSEPAPAEPVAVALLVGHATARPQQGSLVLRRLIAQSDAPAAELAEPWTLPEPALTLLGWTLRDATWERQWRRPLLRGVLAGGAACDLEIALPRDGRDWTRRAHLSGDSVPLRLALPLPAGNPHGRYALSWSASAEGHGERRELVIAGVRSDADALGAPRPTRELPPSCFGTAGHFALAGGAFAGWADRERLLDAAAACGLGWLRDGASLARGSDGAWIADATANPWLAGARARGLRTIAILPLEAGEPVEVLCARGEALARARDLVDAIELGNEPNNFGGWVKTHGGTWNGRDADGATAPWVKAHLAATNAVAEAIKRVRPDAMVLGLGAPPPVNARALDLGLSPAVDGVVEHPYGYSLPPEAIAYGLPFAGRDGIAVGDAGCTLAGLLDWYRDRLAAAGQPRRLWITEFGWTTCRDRGGDGLYAGVDETVQADWLVRGHLLHAWHGAAASVHYELLDDYGSAAGEPQANFGLIRADGSRKPAYAAVQRLCSLFAGAVRDADAVASVERAPLAKGRRPTVLAADWDGVAIPASCDVVALPFLRRDRPGLRTLALWSALAPDALGGRPVAVRIRGWAGFGQALAVGLRSGRVVDVPWRRDGDDLVLEPFLPGEPLAVQVFRD